MALTNAQQDALKRIAEASVASEVNTRVPAQLTAAQGILESGWLSKAPGNNPFGIKAKPGQALTQWLDSYEWFMPSQYTAWLGSLKGRAGIPTNQVKPSGRKLYRVRDLFAAYSSLSDAFTAHALLLTSPSGPYYKAIAQYWLDLDLGKMFASVGRVYATAPDYATSLQRIATQTEVVQALAAARAT